MEDQVIFSRIDPSVLENLSKAFQSNESAGTAEAETTLFSDFDKQVASLAQQISSTNNSKNKPKLTDAKIKEFIEAKCWVNGTYLNSLDTEYLVNCKKFAAQRLYEKWYWKYFLTLVNEEILNRDVVIGPKRYYPGTENIPRRGMSKNAGYNVSK